jgi:hypothetical protein
VELSPEARQALEDFREASRRRREYYRRRWYHGLFFPDRCRRPDRGRADRGSLLPRLWDACAGQVFHGGRTFRGSSILSGVPGSGRKTLLESVFILLVLSEPLGCPRIDDLPFFLAQRSWEVEMRPPWGFGERLFRLHLYSLGYFIRVNKLYDIQYWIDERVASKTFHVYRGYSCSYRSYLCRGWEIKTQKLVLSFQNNIAIFITLYYNLILCRLWVSALLCS